MSKTPVTASPPDPGSVDWDETNNELLGQLKTNANERAGASDLDIQGTLTLNGNAITDVTRVVLNAASDPGVAQCLFLSGTDWYVRDGSNNRIRLTTGGSIANGGSGSIGGDYPSSQAAGNALVSYANSSQRYTFVSSAGVKADLETGGLFIYNGSSTGYVKLAAPSGQSSNITYTLPGTLPAGSMFLTGTTDGRIGFTPLMVMDARGLVLSGSAIAGDSLLSVTGTLRQAGSLISTQTGSFQVVSAARDILHTNVFRLQIPACAGSPVSPAFYDNSNLGVSLSTKGTDALHIPVPLRQGDRIEGFHVKALKNEGAGKMSWGLFAHDGIGGRLQIGGYCTTPLLSDFYTLGSGSIVGGTGLGHEVSATGSIVIQVNGAGTTGDVIYSAAVEYRRITGSV